MRLFLHTAILILYLFLGLPSQAQHIQLSLFPGYHIINSDQVSETESNSDITPKTNFIWGGETAIRTSIKGHPIQLSAGYSQGESTIYNTNHVFEIIDERSINLRYNTIPLEALRIFEINESTLFSFGVNTVMQYRVLEYHNFDIPNDRLFSLGIGLSGNLQRVIKSFNSNAGHIFAGLGFRWTEFLIHHKNGRDLDDFTLRHVTLSPKIGVSFNFDS